MDVGQRLRLIHDYLRDAIIWAVLYLGLFYEIYEFDDGVIILLHVLKGKKFEVLQRLLNGFLVAISNTLDELDLQLVEPGGGLNQRLPLPELLVGLKLHPLNYRFINALRNAPGGWLIVFCNEIQATDWLSKLSEKN